MGQSRRRTEKWFNRLLWVIAVIFAGFLIGLGGKIIGDLPLMSEPLYIEQFYQEPQYSEYEKSIREKATERAALSDKSELLNENLSLEKLTYQNNREVFENWLKTRQVTLDPERDQELISRTEHLEAQKDHISQLEGEYTALQLSQKALSSTIAGIRQEINQIEIAGSDAFYQALKTQQLKEFMIRLLLTLPLLVISAYLFAKRRKGRYWPFSWGFIFFSLFAFFFELVPYLPSYGGYVRFGVGIIVTALGGYYAIRGFNRYRERQKAEESVGDSERRKMLNYSFVLQRIDKSLCPSCERGINYRNPAIDFCPHCGITLFKRCHSCHVRKNAFLNYCASCGTKEDNGVVNE